MWVSTGAYCVKVWASLIKIIISVYVQQHSRESIWYQQIQKKNQSKKLRLCQSWLFIIFIALYVRMGGKKLISGTQTIHCMCKNLGHTVQKENKTFVPNCASILNSPARVIADFSIATVQMLQCKTDCQTELCWVPCWHYCHWGWMCDNMEIKMKKVYMVYFCITA